MKQFLEQNNECIDRDKLIEAMEQTEEVKEINKELGSHGSFKSLVSVLMGLNVSVDNRNACCKIVYYLLCGSNKEIISKANIKIDALTPILLDIINELDI